MEQSKLKKLVVKIYPLLITICLWAFLLFAILGFVVKNSGASQVFFGLSFASLILYIPVFILLSKLQHKDWFVELSKEKELKWQAVVQKRVIQNKIENEKIEGTSNKENQEEK